MESIKIKNNENEIRCNIGKDYKVYFFEKDILDFNFMNRDKATSMYEANSKLELYKLLEELLETHEGYVYSVWHKDQILIGGAFDSNDLDTLKMENFFKEFNEMYQEKF
jgi:hypothetical protein